MTFADTEAGKSLRDYFAAKAMQAVLSNNQAIDRIESMAVEQGVEPIDLIARNAYVQADAMMKARDS